jgi:hemolysin activation/secretion protein
LFNGWIGSLRGQLQYSPDALIAGEQFGLGGVNSVRGIGERPIAGDSGAVLSAEITMPELMPGLRLLGFVDAGWLANNNPNGNPKPSSDSLSSAGLGLRYVLNHAMLTVDFGRIIRGSTLPYTAGSGLPQSGDQKLHVNLSARF